jgi:hypothetical protein
VNESSQADGSDGSSQAVKRTVWVAENESWTPCTAWPTSLPDAVLDLEVRRTPPVST